MVVLIVHFLLSLMNLRTFILETEKAWLALGKVSYGPTDAGKRALRIADLSM